MAGRNQTAMGYHSRGSSNACGATWIRRIKVTTGLRRGFRSIFGGGGEETPRIEAARKI